MNRTRASAACASVGVLLVVMAALSDSEVALFAGLALLVVSHVLTPCLDRIAVWRKRLLR
jgi:hypothetical protein